MRLVGTSSLALFVAIMASHATADGIPAIPRDQIRKVDALFARWDSKTTPGGVVALVRDGAVVHEHAFGMANLGFAIPNTPRTLFHIASISKQFTAFAILLLQQEGRLSLEDDVRTYVPELPNFGKTITLRNLLHHTSGLRDQSHLMWMAGWGFEDEVTVDDVLRVFSRQRELNFQPGEQSLYCNTGYTLLGVVVERVSGRSLAQFSAERIFKPLGMSHTQIQGDHHCVIPNRADSYRPGKSGGYEAMSLSDSTVGETGVVTNVDDLARWDENFYDAKVGGQRLIAQMQEPGHLNDGRPTRYAAGLGVDQYRGLTLIEHSGSIAGFRCHYLRVPACRVSVIVLSNAEDLPATDLAHRVADIILADRERAAEPASPPRPASTQPANLVLATAVLDAYTGDYQLANENFVTITRLGSQLLVRGSGSGQVPLFAQSPTTFALKKPGASIIFVKAPGSSHATDMRLLVDGNERRARWFEAPPLSAYTGDFYSPELRVIYGVELRQGQLYLDYPRGQMAMTRTTPDCFDLSFPLNGLHFQRDKTGHCVGFVIAGERARNVEFRKVELPANQ